MGRTGFAIVCVFVMACGSAGSDGQGGMTYYPSEPPLADDGPAQPCPTRALCGADDVIQPFDGDDTSDDAMGGKDGQDGDRELADAQPPDATADVGRTVDAGQVDAGPEASPPVDAGLCCNGCLPTLYPCGTILLGAYPVTCTMGYCTASCVIGVTSRGSVVACQ